VVICRYSLLTAFQLQSNAVVLVLVARKVRTVGGKYPNSLAAGLTYVGLRSWMNGSRAADFRGAFERWQISQDGEPDQPIYHYRTHRARHDRQTVLLQHGAPPVARLRDLNTRSRDAHLIYGHAWDELTNELFDRATSDPKATLIDKATRGVLVGEGVRVILATIDKPDTHGFTPGDPAFLTPERQARLRNHPRAFELNRVPGGICLLAQGPVACPEYLLCVEATRDGCSQYVSDTENLINLPLQVRTVEVSILMVEPRDFGPIRISLRSKGQVDVARFAEQFGGGVARRADDVDVRHARPSPSATSQPCGGPSRPGSAPAAA